MKMPVRRRSAKKKSLFKDLDSPFSVAPDRGALRNLENVEIPASSPISEKKKKVKKKGYLNRVKPRRRKKNKKMKRRLVTTTRLKSIREVDLEWISETLEKSVDDCVFEGLRCARITLPVDDWTTQRVFRVTHVLQKHIDFKEKDRQFYIDWYVVFEREAREFSSSNFLMFSQEYHLHHSFTSQEDQSNTSTLMSTQTHYENLSRASRSNTGTYFRKLVLCESCGGEEQAIHEQRVRARSCDS